MIHVLSVTSMKGSLSKVKKSNRIKTFWGDAFKSIKEIEDSKYDNARWFFFKAF